MDEKLNNILRKDGLSVAKLDELSYRSKLGISLKKNLHYFDEEKLFEELTDVGLWYDTNELLRSITTDYRIKSIQSARLKYKRYYPDHQLRKVFDDLLGFRVLCDSYESVLELVGCENIRVANMSNGKANDDGYRGVHIYFQKSNSHYPVEIQYNTYYDRQLNNWLHKYLYKKNIIEPQHNAQNSNMVGRKMRTYYEMGKIRTEDEFKEVLKNVLSNCERY